MSTAKRKTTTNPGEDHPASDEEDDEQLDYEKGESAQQQQQQQQQQLLDPEYEEYLRSKTEASMDRMRAILDQMTPDELNRYETYRSATFPKPVMRKLVGQILDQNCTEKMAIVVAGAAKLFVGDLVEKARDVMVEINRGDKGEEEGKDSIRPIHLREANRRLRLAGKIPNASRYRPRLFPY